MEGRQIVGKIFFHVYACVLSWYLVPMWNASLTAGLIQKSLKYLLTGLVLLASTTVFSCWTCSLGSLHKGLCSFIQRPSNSVQRGEIRGITWVWSAKKWACGPLTSQADFWWSLLNFWVSLNALEALAHSNTCTLTIPGRPACSHGVTLVLAWPGSITWA